MSDRVDLIGILSEALNSAHGIGPDRLNKIRRHDGHERHWACLVCRGDVGELAAHLANRLLSSGHVTRARTADREDGAALIAAERQRQVEAEGWTAEHDDGQSNGELALAALCYTASYGALGFTDEHWPWSEGSWKPTGDRVADLTKAGALLAAEIDRLRRAAVEGGVRDGG